MVSKFNANKYSRVDLVEPEILKVVNSDGTESTLIISKEVQGYINKKLGLSSSFSKKLFDISKRCWKEIVVERSVNEDGEIKLDLNDENISFIKNENDKIISITESPEISKNIEKFFSDVDKYCISCVDKKDNLTKIILQSTNKEYSEKEYTPIVLVELDYSSGNYRSFNGLKVNSSGYIVVLAPSVNSWSLAEFLGLFNAEVEISMSEKLSGPLFSDFSSYNKGMKLSIREVLQFLRESGVTIETSEDGLVSDVPGISSSYSENITEFFNSFDMPFKSLLKLGYLKKSLKSNEFTIGDILGLLSNEYTNPILKISGYTILNVINILNSGENDSLIVETEIAQK